MIRIVTVKTISRFWILELREEDDIRFNWKNNKLRINQFFWNSIFNIDFLEFFLLKKYIKFKADELSIEKEIILKKEINFLIEKLPLIKERINFYNSNKVPLWEDVFYHWKK